MKSTILFITIALVALSSATLQAPDFCPRAPHVKPTVVPKKELCPGSRSVEVSSERERASERRKKERKVEPDGYRSAWLWGPTPVCIAGFSSSEPGDCGFILFFFLFPLFQVFARVC